MNRQSFLSLPLLLTLLGFVPTSQALTDLEAEELADLTAVFFYLKQECGYQALSIAEIKRALISFAHQNRWDLSNYNQLNMDKLGQLSFDDLKKIPIATEKKCSALANDSFIVMSN